MSRNTAPMPAAMPRQDHNPTPRSDVDVGAPDGEDTGPRQPPPNAMREETLGDCLTSSADRWQKRADTLRRVADSLPTDILATPMREYKKMMLEGAASVHHTLQIPLG